MMTALAFLGTPMGALLAVIATAYAAKRALRFHRDSDPWRAE